MEINDDPIRELVEQLAAPSAAAATPPRQASYAYLKSAFALRKTSMGEIVLLCFNATNEVRDRLKKFTEFSAAWTDVLSEPYALFDLVIEGLYKEVDTNVWSMNRVFGFRYQERPSV